MILFAAVVVRRFAAFLLTKALAETRDSGGWLRFSRSLYPKTSDEKRWIDGVLARKKGLGF